MASINRVLSIVSLKHSLLIHGCEGNAILVSIEVDVSWDGNVPGGFFLATRN
jgi:hypothetical protein